MISSYNSINNETKFFNYSSKREKNNIKNRRGITQNYSILHSNKGSSLISLDAKYYVIQQYSYCYIKVGTLFSFINQTEDFEFDLVEFSKEDIVSELRNFLNQDSFVLFSQSNQLDYVFNVIIHHQFNYVYEREFYINKLLELLSTSPVQKELVVKEDLELEYNIQKIRQDNFTNILPINDAKKIEQFSFRYNLTPKQYINKAKCIYSLDKKEDGISAKEACRLYNISYSTLYRYKRLKSKEKLK